MLIGFCGPPQAGKTTSALALAKLGFARHSFAAELKKAATSIFALEDDAFEVGIKDKPSHLGCSPRALAIALGNFAREWWPEVWIWHLHKFLVEPDATIDDVRGINEAEYIRARGGFLVRIERPGFAHPIRDNPLEAEASAIVADYTVSAATPAELEEKLGALVPALRALEGFKNAGRTPADRGLDWLVQRARLCSTPDGRPASRGAGHEAVAKVGRARTKRQVRPPADSAASEPVPQLKRRGNNRVGGDAVTGESGQQSDGAARAKQVPSGGVQAVGDAEDMANERAGDGQVVLPASDRLRLAKLGQGPKEDLLLRCSGINFATCRCGPTDITLAEARMGYGGHYIRDDHVEGRIVCHKCGYGWRGAPTLEISSDIKVEH